MRLYEAKDIDNDAKLSMLSSEVISDTLSMVSQAHLWHWQTKSYASHTALGDFYESLQASVDTLAETFMGAGGTLNNVKANDLKPFDENSTIEALKAFRNKLNETQAEFMEKENSPFHTVGDTILDIVKNTDKLLYLLTLK